MFKGNKKLFGIFICAILLLIVIPSSFAVSNGDVQFNDSLKFTDNANVIEITSDDVLGDVDYYFDASSNETGDGSIENPYSDLTLNRIKSSSTIHLTNGVYNLTSGKTLNDVTIIGQDAEKTIINYTGVGTVGKFTVGIDNYVMLSNVTLIGFNFDIEGGNLQANNTIFKNSMAVPQSSAATNLVNSASNSFGGTIYAYFYQNYYNTYLPMIILDNCTFVNNSGEYGGAICMNKGDLYITDCLFRDNYAYNYGGAIAAIYDVNVRVKNTKFINDFSIADAGGAIYLLQSKLSASNMTAINCSATFGSVVTSLNSTTAIYYLNATDNVAKYDGGAIFQMYNGLTISDSYFENNKALNGGAVYVNSAQVLNLEYNCFNNNLADVTGGAVYSILNNKPTFKNNNYTGNKANKNDDLYQTDSIVMNIGNGNYTLFYNNYTFDGVLPSYYSLIDEGLVTPVKDQQSGGNCWAFGALAALESAILKASNVTYDLSEENMKNLMQTYSDYGWSEIETNNGGYDAMSIGYLVSWLGPIKESIESYDDYSMLSPVLNAVTHVQNIVYLGRSTYTDNDAIKEAIMKYGAVSTGIYYDSTYFYNSKNSYYYYGSGYANHAVAIVGWDDNYSKNNFNYKPAGDGAWIVKNSWNENWGNNGYFYVSYYDTQLAEVGQKDASFAFIFNDTEKYDKNYQYDIIGKTDYLVTGEKTIWARNIFKSTDNELLAAVSTYFRKTTDWELFIYVNDQLALTKNGTSSPGYYTIDLGEKIPISLGDEFSVVFKLSCDSGAEIGISEKITANKLTYSPGISFLSFDGTNWTDLYYYENDTELDGGHTYYSQVAAIKAFTILYELQPSIKLSISNNYNIANITAVVYDQYDNLIRSGDVVFNIGHDNYTVKIENDEAVLSHIFENIGVQDIVVNYKHVNATAALNVTKLFLDIELDIIKNKNNITLNFNSLKSVNTTLILNSNSQLYYIDLINGQSTLAFNDLDYGFYNVSAHVYDDKYAGELNSNFNITISKTVLIAEDLISYNEFEKKYSVKLEDIYGNPVANHQISLILNGNSYVATTDEDGIVIFNLKLDNKSNYKMNVLFYGDDSYFASTSNPNVYMKSTVIFPNESNVVSGLDYNFILLDFNGNPLNAIKANLISIDGVEYWEINNNSGNLSKNIDLKAGSHVITVKNSFTGEIVSKTINVVNRIMENKNIATYYLASTYYKALVYGDDGNIAKSGEIVTIKVNKKTYSAKVASNGYISFKLPTLKPGSYTLTATYKGFKVSNKITIKPLLITKNLSKKKAKTIKYTAKLVNYKGQVVKGKIIKFKINKKTYKVKTNKKGIATLSLKNLKVGSYKITSTYGKSVNTNTIKIKK